MRFFLALVFVGMSAASGCAVRTGCSVFTTSEEKAVADSVRTYMRSVAHDVTQDGPTAWEKHFQNSPAFFMADNGQLVFPDTRAAAQGTEAFARTIKHIELRWGNDLRIDPLTPNLAVVAASYQEVQVDTADHTVNESGFFTGVAENRSGQWQFRDAHWSEPVPPAKAP